MKIKRKFAISNILMLAIPISIIGIAAVVMIFYLMIKLPSDMPFDEYSMLMNKNPLIMKAILAWAVICISVIAVTVTVVTTRLAKSISAPIQELREAVSNISDGNLDFEVMGSSYEEINSLCESFDVMRKTLKSAREREIEMQKERSMLIANISHDLKTPVTSIKGYLDGIRDGVADTPEKMDKYLETVYQKTLLMEELISNLSIFSKLELSKLIFHFQQGDIIDFVRETAEEYRLDLERRDMELELKLPDKMIPVMMDHEQLHRVFANLIDNAAKYKRQGRGHIEISAEENDAGVLVRVCDAGIGIKPEELEAVFDEFYRADASRNTAIKGSGLGLGIAKQIVQRHGGKIWLRSLEQGTMAVVYLPKVKEREEKA